MAKIPQLDIPGIAPPALIKTGTLPSNLDLIRRKQQAVNNVFGEVSRIAKNVTAAALQRAREENRRESPAVWERITAYTQGMDQFEINELRNIPLEQRDEALLSKHAELISNIGQDLNEDQQTRISDNILRNFTARRRSIANQTRSEIDVRSAAQWGSRYDQLIDSANLGADSAARVREEVEAHIEDGMLHDVITTETEAQQLRDEATTRIDRVELTRMVDEVYVASENDFLAAEVFIFAKEDGRFKVFPGLDEEVRSEIMSALNIRVRGVNAAAEAKMQELSDEQYTQALAGVVDGDITSMSQITNAPTTYFALTPGQNRALILRLDSLDQRAQRDRERLTALNLAAENRLEALKVRELAEKRRAAELAEAEEERRVKEVELAGWEASVDVIGFRLSRIRRSGNRETIAQEIADLRSDLSPENRPEEHPFLDSRTVNHFRDEMEAIERALESEDQRNERDRLAAEAAAADEKERAGLNRDWLQVESDLANARKLTGDDRVSALNSILESLEPTNAQRPVEVGGLPFLAKSREGKDLSSWTTKINAIRDSPNADDPGTSDAVKMAYNQMMITAENHADRQEWLRDNVERIGPVEYERWRKEVDSPRFLDPIDKLASDAIEGLWEAQIALTDDPDEIVRLTGLMATMLTNWVSILTDPDPETAALTPTDKNVAFQNMLNAQQEILLKPPLQTFLSAVTLGLAFPGPYPKEIRDEAAALMVQSRGTLNEDQALAAVVARRMTGAAATIEEEIRTGGGETGRLSTNGNILWVNLSNERFSNGQFRFGQPRLREDGLFYAPEFDEDGNIVGYSEPITPQALGPSGN